MKKWLRLAFWAGLVLVVGGPVMLLIQSASRRFNNERSEASWPNWFWVVLGAGIALLAISFVWKRVTASKSERARILTMSAGQETSDTPRKISEETQELIRKKKGKGPSGHVVSLGNASAFTAPKPTAPSAKPIAVPNDDKPTIQ